MFYRNKKDMAKSFPSLRRGSLATDITRCLLLPIIVLGGIYVDKIQSVVNILWQTCLASPMFNSVYFETWFATFCYAVIIPIYPFALHYMTFMDKFKVQPNVKYESITILKMIREAGIYMTPLMLLDTFMVKKYAGAAPEEVNRKQENWIQVTRVLPMDPPTVVAVGFQLVASVLLFDALFFFVHLLLHKNTFLYKHVHAHHHHHDNLHAHVTNQLTILERVTLILSANFALKVFYSHPLTRAIFVPVFIFLLVDNHSGYDLPFGIHRVLPWGVYGGAPHHYEHHTHGKRYYQPFFTYLDNYLARF